MVWPDEILIGGQHLDKRGISKYQVVVVFIFFWGGFYIMLEIADFLALRFDLNK